MDWYFGKFELFFPFKDNRRTVRHRTVVFTNTIYSTLTLRWESINTLFRSYTIRYANSDFVVCQTTSSDVFLDYDFWRFTRRWFGIYFGLRFISPYWIILEQKDTWMVCLSRLFILIYIWNKQGYTLYLCQTQICAQIITFLFVKPPQVVFVWAVSFSDSK